MTEVVAALIWDNDKFMICQRPENKARALLWEFVGGKVEVGETKEEALIRECQEELAITLSVGDVFVDVVHEYPDMYDTEKPHHVMPVLPPPGYPKDSCLLRNPTLLDFDKYHRHGLFSFFLSFPN